MTGKTNSSRRLQDIRNRDCWVFGNHWRRVWCETVWWLDLTDPDPLQILRRTYVTGFNWRIYSGLQVKEVLPSFSEYLRSTSQQQQQQQTGDGGGKMRDMQIHYHVEGDVNAAYSEILLARLCSGAWDSAVTTTIGLRRRVHVESWYICERVNERVYLLPINYPTYITYSESVQFRECIGT